MSNSIMWYYRNAQKKEGAFSEEEFTRLIQMGIIEENDEIWMMEMENWMVLKETIYSFYINKKEDIVSSNEN